MTAQAKRSQEKTPFSMARCVAPCSLVHHTLLWMCAAFMRGVSIVDVFVATATEAGGAVTTDDHRLAAMQPPLLCFNPCPLLFALCSLALCSLALCSLALAVCDAVHPRVSVRPGWRPWLPVQGHACGEYSFKDVVLRCTPCCIRFFVQGLKDGANMV